MAEAQHQQDASAGPAVPGEPPPQPPEVYERFCVTGADGVERIVGPLIECDSRKLVPINSRSWWLHGSQTKIKAERSKESWRNNNIVHEISNVIADLRGKKTRLGGRKVDTHTEPLPEVISACVRGYTLCVSSNHSPPAIEYTKENVQWLLREYVADMHHPPTAEISKKRVRTNDPSPSPSSSPEPRPPNDEEEVDAENMLNELVEACIDRAV